MIGERLRKVRAEVIAACTESDRDPATVQLIAVSKTHTAAAVIEAHGAGQIDFGESYPQELRDKALAIDGVRWHFIGRLQRNKAKYVAPVAFRVHSLESVAQAEALAKRAPGPLKCLLSVNIALEESKGGVRPDRALDTCRTLHGVPGIEMVGLMCLPPAVEDPEDSQPWFAELAHLAAEGRSDGLPLNELSMGMSSDFAVAIRNGANWIRVGTAIFGPRS